jgi:hypothetical protein
MQSKPTLAKFAFPHDSRGFDCGNEALNRFIEVHALQGQRANISRTYVALSEENAIVGLPYARGRQRGA